MRISPSAVRRGFAAACAVLLVGITGVVRASHSSVPTFVALPGTVQSELGCPGDWQPDCANTRLTFDADDGVWQGTWTVPAGTWEYKAALDNSWDENYGANATANGANIVLSLAQASPVKFYYDHKTHWVTSNRNAIVAVAPGSFQSELGCASDWDPSCLRSWLQDPDGDGIYTFTTASLPAGNYEVKVAINESWDENYGAGGIPNGPNIPFTVSGDCAAVTFSFDSATHTLTVASGGDVAQPGLVVIPGSLQSEAGCAGDWDPACSATSLMFDTGDRVWQGTFGIPAGSWEYKAALNGGWDENYGANATRNGANIPLALESPARVKFYYDHATHWVVDNRTKLIATVPGSFQSELGCPGDWQPDCLRSWLQDPDGDGVYSFTTASLPAAAYEAKVAIDESWSENYGAGGARDGANIPFTVAAACTPITFTYDAATHVLTIGAAGAPPGNLAQARAHWVARDAIVWTPPSAAFDGVVQLHYAPGGLTLGAGGVSGGTTIPLTHDAAGLSEALREKFPHLASRRVYRLPAGRIGDVPAILKGQIAVSALAPDGTLVDAASLQIPGALDDLFTYNGPLGVTFEDGVPVLRVWAPTARSVRVQLFDSSTSPAPSAVIPMTADTATGVWRVSGEASWTDRFYRYDVEVFVRSTGGVEHNLVTDPYSVSLSRNSARSQIVNLDAAKLKPSGWDQLEKPALAAPEDIVLYELHVRDFSASDATVPADARGTFGAFAAGDSAGMRHLAALARAGLTHIHLLPSFDIASVNEDRSTWRNPDEEELTTKAPDSAEQQEAVRAVANDDPYNWGYDPWHYNVPEGSYAKEPEGSARTLEFRAMVKSLSDAGLRVVMDVVYNHTSASGQNDRSVLDRIVPGYYHRLNMDGNVERSTCCENTATEHAMMERLMVDSVVLWAKQYKVDGFRFDLMGHHMKRNMTAVRAALDALTLERDGVDGRKIYLYGEAWNFGEVADNARGVNAIQRNMAGTGIGSFNDRIRDGARGGGPFSGLQEQGFLTGLFCDSNGTNQGTPDNQRAELLRRTDWIRAALAGNLADFQFVDASGTLRSAREIDYNGQPAGYTADPQEDINYIEAHDNETLFDAIQLKAAGTASVADRVRMQNLGMSLVAFAQGVPFFHAGVDLLRSKSLDRNSYNSGDWFNRLDLSGAANNWGVGLPPASDNSANWPVMRPLLANPALAPTGGDIADAAEHFKEVLRIRRSSGLFRLRTAGQITSRLKLHNTGDGQTPGLVVMGLSDAGGDIDPMHDLVVVLVNANDEPATFRGTDFVGRRLALHPIQAASHDPVVRGASFTASDGTFRVPGRTAAVFWSMRPVADQIVLLDNAVAGLVADGTLSAGRGRSLRAKLAAAKNQAARGGVDAARHQLRAFVHEVNALAGAGLLPAAQADALLHRAEEIMGGVGVNR